MLKYSSLQIIHKILSKLCASVTMKKAMTIHFSQSPLQLDRAVEDEIRLRLRQHLSPCYQDRTKSYIENLLATDGYVDRFQYLHSVVGPDVFHPSAKILIAGFGAGSEMITAKQFGFGLVYGVEVDPFWVSICQSRLYYLLDMYPSYYKGDYLPYTDKMFDVVASGHVIEHTHVPYLHLQECLRVLKHYGYLSLEFPSRYHHTELHTQLPSFEWLPRSIRNGLLRSLSGRFSLLRDRHKSRYYDIVASNLQQISMGGVRRMLKRTSYPHLILNKAKPAPGIIRCIIQKV